MPLSHSISTSCSGECFISSPGHDELLLLCCEDTEASIGGDSPLDSPDSSMFSFPVGALEAEEEEWMGMLVEEEEDYSPGFDYPARFRSHSLEPSARHQSVAWILKVRAYYGFRPLTAYLAVNYMDRFLSSRRLPASGWPMQLLSVACLSIASKMEETLVPSLIDLQVEDERYMFEPRTIRRMELLVLTTLNWKLRSVTPFTFIDFFAFKADRTSRKHTRYLVSRATQIILATMQEIKFLDCYSSSVAAAAIASAANETLGLSFVNPVIAASWCAGLTRDGIASCYQLVQELVVDDHRRRKAPRILPQMRVTTPVNMAYGISPSSSSTSPSLSGNKRRKLSDSSSSCGDDDKERSVSRKKEEKGSTNGWKEERERSII